MANHKSCNFRVYSEAKIRAIIFLEGDLRNSYMNFPLITSITVMREAIDEMRKQSDRSHLISSLFHSFDEWNITSLYPIPVVAEICYRLTTEGVDYRVENTDRVHLGYALAFGCDLFITSDKNLKKYWV